MKAFYVESEIFFCAEGSVLAIISGTFVIDLTPFGIKPSLAKAHWFAALGQEVVIVVLQMVTCVQICFLLFLVFVFQAQLPKTKTVCLCIFVYT